MSDLSTSNSDVNDPTNNEKECPHCEESCHTEAFTEETAATAIVSVSQATLDKLKNEADEYKEKYVRLLAESENARKRLQKERKEMIQYALQNLVVDFLIPIDHMENALKHAKQMSEEVKHWAIGFEMILTQFKDILTNNGATPFESEGQIFDPHCHEAIEMIETEEHAPGTIVTQTIRGYKMGERIIRPARVTVAKSPVKQTSTDVPQTDDSENVEPTI